MTFPLMANAERATRLLLIDICNLPSNGWNTPVDLVIDYSYQINGTLRFESPSWFDSSNLISLKMFKNEKIICRLGSTIYITNLNSHTLELKFRVNLSRSIDSLLVLENQRLVLSGNIYGEIDAYSIDSGKLIKTFDGHINIIRELILVESSEDDNIFASTSDDSTVRLWKTDSTKCIQVLKPSIEVDGLSYIKAFNNKIIASSYDCHIFIWDYTTNVQLQYLHLATPENEIVNILCFDGSLSKNDSLTKNYALINSCDLIVRLNIVTGEQVNLAFAEPIQCVINVTNNITNSVTNTVCNNIIAIGSMCGTIYISNIDTMSHVQILHAHKNCIIALTMLTDGRLISSSIDGIMYIWNTNTWQCENRLHRSGLSSFVSVDKYLVTASFNGRISIFD